MKGLIKLMNKYIEYNKKLFKEKEDGMVGDSFVKRCGYKCIKCGEEVSPKTVEFFNDNIVKVLCYTCQGINK